VTDHQEPDAPEAASAEDPRLPLEAEIERLRAEADRFRDEMLRARAELDNVRKRAQRDVESAHKYGVEKLVDALLPVKDSLDLGLDAAGAAPDVNTLREGMVMTVQMFDAALTRIGVQTIEEAGVRFDPEQHQAMMMEPSLEAEAGTVLRVLQKGYRMSERLVRPAMVVVAKAPDAPAGT
jgi:molecular chaperone GrpE